MAKTRQQKEAAIETYAESLKKAKSLVFVNFDGLKVKEIEKLRKRCRNEKVGYVVAKKTLMKMALKDANFKDIDPKTFPQSIATLFGYDDEVMPAKIVGEFAKEHEALKPIGGILENQFINKDKVLALSKLPSRQELLAKVVGSFKAPVRGFVNVLSGTLRSLVYALNAVKDSKQ